VTLRPRPGTLSTVFGVTAGVGLAGVLLGGITIAQGKGTALSWLAIALGVPVLGGSIAGAVLVMVLANSAELVVTPRAPAGVPARAAASTPAAEPAGRAGQAGQAASGPATPSRSPTSPPTRAAR
jgi:hypothetical protein